MQFLKFYTRSGHRPILINIKLVDDVRDDGGLATVTMRPVAGSPAPFYELADNFEELSDRLFDIQRAWRADKYV